MAIKQKISEELTAEFKKTLSMTKLVNVEVDSELRQSFIDYAMAVNRSRAIPDVRDGLKPVHRRILYSMNEMGLTPDKPFKKCAAIVGDVLGKYHPHGDSSVYDALVRMAQDFSINLPLVDGHGNFGSVDGDPAAAYRYTEAKMSKLALELLRDLIGKDPLSIDEIISDYGVSEYLIKKLPFLDPKKFIFTSSKQLVKGDVIIDDYFGNLKGDIPQKFLFDSYHNKEKTDEELKERGVVRVKGWKEVCEILLKE